MINEKQAKRFCKEDISKIKNYDLAIADKTQTWDCHHMTETWWNCTKKELIENECYYHRKACELIFLTHAEHISLHMKGKPSTMKGRTHSDESRKKMSEAQKGKHLSEEHRRKISETNKGHILSEETRIKLSESHKGKVPWNKGKRHTEETRIKISAALKLRWAAKKNLKKDII